MRVPRRKLAPPPVSWRGGVQIAGTQVWCDARRARGLTFVSYAGAGVAMAAHGKVLTTARTAALLEALGRANGGETLVTPASRPFSLGAARLELFPSGRAPGAASLWVQAEGREVVYAGEIDAQVGLGEAMEVRGAEVLVVAAPLAALSAEVKRGLPPRGEAAAQLVQRVEAAIEAGQVPVVLAGALGAAEEAMAALGRAGIGLRAHPRLVALAEAYRGLGIALPEVRRPSAKGAGREALVWPIELRGAAALARVARRRTIAATGAAIDPDAARRLGVDEAVALGEGVDLEGLCDYAAHTGAREVYLTAGHSEAVARALGARGVKSVAPLGPPRQMDLFG